MFVTKNPLRHRPGFQMHNQRGVSLIEVLVSIVIASIALLALAGVNASSIRFTKMSQHRATAALLANDIGERMRANRGKPLVGAVAATGFMAGAYEYVESFSSQATKATKPTPECNTAASNCSPAQIAAIDLAEWRIVVRDQLPEGSVFIALDIGDVAADVWVAWRDPAVAESDEALINSGCPSALSLGSEKNVSCSFFRINL